MSWLPVSCDRGAGPGCSLMRMQPGATTIAYEHREIEEFLALDSSRSRGDLVDSDRTVFRPDDFASYEAGPRHHLVD